MTRILLALAALLASGPAVAWGPAGHKAVAIVAASRLAPGAAQAVAELLGPRGRLDSIANCADSMLYASAPFDCGGAFTLEPDSKRATGPWHFINVELPAQVARESVQEACRGDDCLITRVQSQLAVLADESAPKRDRQVALMFVVHLVGDLHQPLHVADQTVDGQSDHGGNGKAITFRGVAGNLHKLLDSALDPVELARPAPGPDGEMLLKGVALYREGESRWAATDAAAWSAAAIGPEQAGELLLDAAYESYALARGTVYDAYFRARAGDVTDELGEPARLMAARRIETAGVRLAALLNGALAAHQAPAWKPVAPRFPDRGIAAQIRLETLGR